MVGGVTGDPPQIFLGEVTVTPPPDFFGRVTGDPPPPQIKVTLPNRRNFFRSRGGPRQLHFVLYIFATRYD